MYKFRESQFNAQYISYSMNCKVDTLKEKFDPLKEKSALGSELTQKSNPTWQENISAFQLYAYSAIIIFFFDSTSLKS